MLRRLSSLIVFVSLATLAVARQGPVDLELREVGKDYVLGVSGPLFDTPIALTFAPGIDDLMFVAQKGRSSASVPGRVRAIRNGHVISPDFLVLGDDEPNFDAQNHTGLVGLAMHPDYATNGRFFVCWTETSGTPTMTVARVEEYHAVDPYQPELGATFSHLLISYELAPALSTHAGGRMEFAPQPPIGDGALYIGTGDGTDSSNGQNSATLSGGLLRLDVDGPPPYYDPGKWGSALWARGLRHPVGINFDASNGNLWIAETGGICAEEVNRVSFSQLLNAPTSEINFGWDALEGASCQCQPNGMGGCPAPSFCVQPTITEAPIHEYSHGGCSSNCAASISGGRIYRGDEIPEIDGHFFFGDYCRADLFSLDPLDQLVAWQMCGAHVACPNPIISLPEFGGGPHPIQPFVSGIDRGDFAGIGEDARGELYFLDLNSHPSANGKIYKLVEASISDPNLMGGAPCGGAVNPDGFVADLCAVGSTVVAAQDLTFVARNTSDQAIGVLAMSPSLLGQATPDGVCLAAPVSRFLANPAAGGDYNEQRVAVDFQSFPGNQITAGSTWYFQFWYRGPGIPAQGIVTNAVAVTFQ